jgi:hypothetical protein
VGGDSDRWEATRTILAGGGDGVGEVPCWEVTLLGLGTRLKASGRLAWFEALKRCSKPVLGGDLISDRW